MPPSPHIPVLVTAAVMSNITTMQEMYQMAFGSLPANLNDTALSAAVAPFFEYEPALYMGMALLSCLLDGLFLGVLLLQIANYWRAFGKTAEGMMDFAHQRDSLWLRGVVGLLGLFAVLGTALVYLWSWRSFVINYGTSQDFAKENIVTLFLPISGCMTLIAQLHYSHKVFVLWKRNWFVVVFPCLMAFTTFISAIYMRVTLYQQKYILFDAPKGIVVGNFIWLVSAVLSDVYITTFLTLALRASRTGWEKTDKLLNKIAWSMAEVQAPPTLLAVAMMIEFVAKCEHMVNCDAYLKLPYLILGGKLYAMSVLCNLNSRRGHREEMYATKGMVKLMTTSSGSGQSSASDLKVCEKTSITNSIESSLPVVKITHGQTPVDLEQRLRLDVGI